MSIRSHLSAEERGQCVLCAGTIMHIIRDILHISRFVGFLHKNDILTSVKSYAHKRDLT